MRKNNYTDWQTAWQRELDMKELPLADYVKNEPIPRVEQPVGLWQRLAALMQDKRIMAGAGVFAMLIIAVCAVIFLKPTAPISPQHASTVIAVEINPSVLMSTDKDGLVVSCVALNEDADSVLSLESFSEGVVGKPLAEAVTAYTDMCARLGFIDFAGDAVRISGVGESFGDIEGALAGYFKENGIFAVVDARERTLAEFSELYGIHIGGGTLESAVGAMQSFYTDRCGEGKELDELISDYRSTVMANVELYIKEEISAELDGLQGELAEIINELLLELVGNNEELARIIGMLEAHMGEDAVSDALEGLAELPRSREEYFDKLREYRSYRTSELERRNEEAYEALRERIDDDSYEDYIEGIIREYGSLSQYFDRQADDSE